MKKFFIGLSIGLLFVAGSALAFSYNGWDNNNFNITGNLSVTGNSTLANPVVLNSISYTFPTFQGASSTILATNGSGKLSWTAAGAGDAILANNQTFSGQDIFSNLLKIPSSATLLTQTAGEIGIDTTSGQLRYNNGSTTSTLVGFQTRTVTVASTTWNTSVTTTIPLGFAVADETWSAVGCYTDTATATVRFGDGSNFMTAITAGPSVNNVIMSSNNTFTALTKQQVQIGTFTGTPNYLTCSVKKSWNPD